MKAQPSIAETILTLATGRGAEKSICPSEVARALWPDDWRGMMDSVREEAFRLRDEGRVRITQGGDDVAGNDVRGPIRIAVI